MIPAFLVALSVGVMGFNRYFNWTNVYVLQILDCSRNLAKCCDQLVEVMFRGVYVTRLLKAFVIWTHFPPFSTGWQFG